MGGDTFTTKHKFLLTFYKDFKSCPNPIHHLTTLLLILCFADYSKSFWINFPVFLDPIFKTLDFLGEEMRI